MLRPFVICESLSVTSTQYPLGRAGYVVLPTDGSGKLLTHRLTGVPMLLHPETTRQNPKLWFKLQLLCRGIML